MSIRPKNDGKPAIKRQQVDFKSNDKLWASPSENGRAVAIAFHYGNYMAVLFPSIGSLVFNFGVEFVRPLLEK